MGRGIGRPRAAHNVVAVFDGMKPAREAVTHLERSGIEAGEISVVAETTEQKEDTSRRDARIIGSVSKRVVLVGAIVGLIGGLLGLLLGLWLLTGPGVWMATAAGAVAGSILGGFIGGMAGLSMSDDWELTFESLREGRVAIAISSDDPQEVEKAAQALGETDARRLERFDAHGQRFDGK